MSFHHQQDFYFMQKKIYILLFFFGILILPQISSAQVDFNKPPDDDLGDVSDAFQEAFFEALKQKAIENYDRAVTSLEECIAIDDSKAILYYELGKNYNKLKDFGAAEDALKKAINKEPDNEWFLDELYDVYFLQKEYDKAIKTVKQLVKYHPDYKEDLASIYMRTKRYKEALKILDELDEELGISDVRDLMRNQIYTTTGNKKERIENLEERVGKDPNSEANYLKLIFRYSENNEKEKAYETAKKLLSINSKSQLVHLALYKFYLDDNRPKDAIASMKIILSSSKIKPESKVKVLADFVQFVSVNQQYESELVAITSKLKETETTGKTFVELAQYYLLKQEKNKALGYYEKALKIEQGNFGILRNILLLQIDLGKHEAAEKLSDQSLEKYPSQPVLYLINGVTLNKLNKPKEALESLEAGLDYIIDSTKMEIDFYKQISKAHTALNNLDKAKTFSEKAKKLEFSN